MRRCSLWWWWWCCCRCREDEEVIGPHAKQVGARATSALVILPLLLFNPHHPQALRRLGRAQARAERHVGGRAARVPGARDQVVGVGAGVVVVAVVVVVLLQLQVWTGQTSDRFVSRAPQQGLYIAREPLGSVQHRAERQGASAAAAKRAVRGGAVLGDG